MAGIVALVFIFVLLPLGFLIIGVIVLWVQTSDLKKAMKKSEVTIDYLQSEMAQFRQREIELDNKIRGLNQNIQPQIDEESKTLKVEDDIAIEVQLPTPKISVTELHEVVMTPVPERQEEVISVEPVVAAQVIQPKVKPLKPKKVKNKSEILSVESIISKLGIFLLLLGIGFIFKWAYDNDHPALAIVVGIVLGGILLLLAFRVEKKKRVILSQVLMGGSIATFYITIYSVYQGFELLSDLSTFFMMIIITTLAFILAVSKNSAALAIIGILGGLMTPFMIPIDQFGVFGIGLYIGLITLGSMFIYYKKQWVSLLISMVVGLFIVLTIIVNSSPNTFDQSDSLLLIALLVLLLIIVNGTDYVLIYFNESKGSHKWIRYTIFTLMPLHIVTLIMNVSLLMDAQKLMIYTMAGVGYLALAYLFLKKEELVISNIQMSLSGWFLLVGSIVFFDDALRIMMIVLLSVAFYGIAYKSQQKFFFFIGHILLTVGLLFAFVDIGVQYEIISQYRSFRWGLLVTLIRLLTTGLLVIAALLNKARIRKTIMIIGLDIYLFLSVMVYIIALYSNEKIIIGSIVGITYMALAYVFWKKEENLIGNIHMTLSSWFLLYGIVNYFENEWRVMMIMLLSTVIYLIAYRTKKQFVSILGHILMFIGIVFAFGDLASQWPEFRSYTDFKDGASLTIVRMIVVALFVFASRLNKALLRKIIAIIGLNSYLLLTIMLYVQNLVTHQKALISMIVGMTYLAIAFIYWKNSEKFMSRIQVYFSAWFLLYATVVYFTDDLRVMMLILLSVIFYAIAYKFKDSYNSLVAHILHGIGLVFALTQLIIQYGGGIEYTTFGDSYRIILLRVLTLGFIVLAAYLNKNIARKVMAVIGLDIYFLMVLLLYMVQLFDVNEIIVLLLLVYGLYFGLLYLIHLKIRLLPELSFVIMTVIPFILKLLLTLTYLGSQEANIMEMIGFVIYGIWIYFIGRYIYKNSFEKYRFFYKILCYSTIIITLLLDLSIYNQQASYGILLLLGVVYFIRCIEPERLEPVFSKLNTILHFGWLTCVAIYVLLMNSGLEFNLLLFISDMLILTGVFFQVKVYLKPQNALWIIMVHTFAYVIVIYKSFSITFDSGSIVTLFLAIYAIALLVISVMKVHKPLVRYALVCILLVAAKLILYDLRQVDIIYKIISSMLFGGALLVLSYVLQPVLARQEIANEEASTIELDQSEEK